MNQLRRVSEHRRAFDGDVDYLNRLVRNRGCHGSDTLASGDVSRTSCDTSVFDGGFPVALWNSQHLGFDIRKLLMVLLIETVQNAVLKRTLRLCLDPRANAFYGKHRSGQLKAA